VPSDASGQQLASRPSARYIESEEEDFGRALRLRGASERKKLRQLAIERKRDAALILRSETETGASMAGARRTFYRF
jgi:hypothetical protein